jgi:hypothetical protein
MWIGRKHDNFRLPLFSNYYPLEAPHSRLSSRPKRTRISCFAALATTTDAVSRKGNRMQRINFLCPKRLCNGVTHSSRSRASGLTDSARCAGIHVASNPSAAIARTTPASTSGSRGVA